MKTVAPLKAAKLQVDSVSGLRDVLREVERDEAEAISLLVNLLAKVRETSQTAPLEGICKVLKEWQNQPPRGIVTSLLKISEEIECPIHAKE